MDVNNIPKKAAVEFNPQKRYGVTITDLETGETLYQHESRGGVICTAEKIDKLGPDVEGQHQLAAWGNPMIQFYTADQLQKWFKKTFPEMLKEFQRQGFINSNVDLAELFNKEKTK